MNNLISGFHGEDIACNFLIKKGFQIIERNFKKRYGEIDIIAIDPSAGLGQEVLVFIEVKTRNSAEFGSPLESITPWKLKSVIKTVQYYTLTHNNLPKLQRIDAIAVDLSDGDQIIEHVMNITEF